MEYKIISVRSILEYDEQISYAARSGWILHTANIFAHINDGAIVYTAVMQRKL